MAKDTGTVNIHGKEYKTVASRVQKFREEHGDKYGTPTEIVSIDADVVVMKASIVRLDDDKVVATGHAEEKRESSQINRTSALENAETSAIGRALASFGLAGTEFASADEVAQAITQQRTPAPKPQPATTVEEPELPHTKDFAVPPVNGTEATPKQIQYIQANFTTLGLKDSQRDEKLAYLTAVLRKTINSSKELTKGDAKKVIDKQLADIEDKTLEGSE